MSVRIPKFALIDKADAEFDGGLMVPQVTAEFVVAFMEVQR